MTKKNSNTKICSKCQKDKKKEDYYLASSDTIHSDSKLGICKDCLELLVGDFKNINTVKNILRMIDRPFLIAEYEGSFNTSKNPFREYMRRLAMRQNRELTWNDSDLGLVKTEGYSDQIATPSQIVDNTPQDEMDELISFFGRGFSKEDYLWLSSEYTDFLNRYECDSKGMELLIKEICLTELDIKKRRSLGEKVDQQLKTLQDLLGSSNLKPVQETGANAVDQESFGTLIKKFENERPIPEPDEKWKDVDGIGKYMKVWFLGHLARMVGLENPYQKEYDEEINKYKIEINNEEEKDDEGEINA